MPVVTAANLHRRYGTVHALDGFNMTVEPGRIVGLIGPNGAGKTTALRAFLGLTPVEGRIEVLGLDPFRNRDKLMRRAAYIADVGTLPRWMRVGQLLEFVASVNASFDFDIARSVLADTEVGLMRKVKTLSKGMVTQLHLAIVLSINAELLTLDEPTLGLDIIYRQRFYDRILNDYHETNRAIVVSTHEVREIEHILTDVVFISKGRDVLTLSMDAIEAEFSQVTVEDGRLGDARALAPISERAAWTGNELIYRGKDKEELARLGEVRTPTLPELFIACVGDTT